MKQATNENLRDRAIRIEKIICEKYCNQEDIDAADIALHELHINSNRNDDEIAKIVVMRIMDGLISL